MREKIHRRANEELPKSERPEEKMRNGKGGVSKNAAAINNSSSMAFLYNLAKGRDQSLCQPEAEDQLGAGHQQLGGETLEEAAHALVLGHVGNDSESRLGVLEVAVLNTGLDHVQGSRDNQRGTGTADGSDEVLGPRGLVVVLQAVDVLLGKGRSTEELEYKLANGILGLERDAIDTYSERARGITGGSPAGTAVKTHTLIRDDLEQATATEGLGVGLTLNLQDIQREQDDLANTDQTKVCCQPLMVSHYISWYAFLTCQQ